MGMGAKIIGSVASIILVVGVAIAVVALVHRHDHKGGGGDGGGGGGGNQVTSSKMSDAICGPTMHKDVCAASIQSVANKPNPTLQDYLKAALDATMSELKKAIDVTNNVKVDKKDGPYHDQMAVDECKEFLDTAVEQLDAAITTVGDSQLHSIQDRMSDFISWLTAVYIYQDTCVSQLEKPQYKNPIQDGMVKSTQLTDNAIYIFSEITNIVGSLNVTGAKDNLGNLAKSAQTAASRRLLEAEEAEKTGFPTWVSTAERRLLQAGSGGAAGGPPPNAVVAQDGSGQFKTITDAVNSMSPSKKGAPAAAAPSAAPAAGGRFIIYVKAGVYNEIVSIKKKNNVFIYGDGIGKTIITGSINFGIMGITTSKTATIGVDADGFMIKDCTVRNTAGPAAHQAVALRVAGQNAVGYQVSFEGYQDPLYYHRGKQFYKNCVITGTVDFIFGNGRAIIQDSTIVVKKPDPNQSNMVTADGGLTPQGEHGLVLQNCKITAEPALEAAKAQFKTYLGRPWKSYCVTMFIQCDIGDFIIPEGFSRFSLVGEGSLNQLTAVYGEYQNIGPGSNTALRDKLTFPHWHVLSPQEANTYTVGSFLQGASWLGASGVPYKPGM